MFKVPVRVCVCVCQRVPLNTHKQAAYTSDVSSCRQAYQLFIYKLPSQQATKITSYQVIEATKLISDQGNKLASQQASKPTS